MKRPQSLFEKLWASHCVQAETSATPALLYIDLHLIHEVTSPQAFATLRSRDLRVRCPQRTLATLDHAVPTLPPNADGQRPYVTIQAQRQVALLREHCTQFGIELHDFDSAARGIVHVMGPEIGATQPGMTIVCGDSHTATHGAFGALAFGIGTTEVGHVLATQCLLQRKPRSMQILIDGHLGEGTGAKDLALHLIRSIGVDGGTGHVLEYAGRAVERLSMEGRMTLCNMSIEAGARAGMIAPDETTFQWLEGRAKVPQGDAFDSALTGWRLLRSDPGADFDHVAEIDASSVRPMITYGTHPGMAVALDETIPQPTNVAERRALEYMGLSAGQPLQGHPVDWVFIGSCTNGRLEDLRAAAAVVAGRQLASGVRMMVVPGSEATRRAAEAEGLDRVFVEAGAEWRLPGCSMCIAMNGDRVAAGATAVSTSNRNFEGRQGPGSRTLLASPATAAASALKGAVADARQFPAREVA